METALNDAVVAEDRKDAIVRQRMLSINGLIDGVDTGNGRRHTRTHICVYCCSCMTELGG
jgi:hypothetical protein